MEYNFYFHPSQGRGNEVGTKWIGMYSILIFTKIPIWRQSTILLFFLILAWHNELTITKKEKSD